MRFVEPGGPSYRAPKKLWVGLLAGLIAWSSAAPALAVTQVDQFTRAGVLVALEEPSGTTQILLMVGPATTRTFFEGVAGQAVDDDGNGLDEVASDLTRLDVSESRPEGLVQLRLNPLLTTLGQTEEAANAGSGTLDVLPYAGGGAVNAYLDIFFELELSDGTLLHNQVAPRIAGQFSHSPAAEQENYFSQQHVPLLDDLGQSTGYTLIEFILFPVPLSGTVEVDSSSNGTLLLELSDGLLGSPPTRLALAGSSESHVFFEGGSGQALDDDGNGLDEVTTEMVSLSLGGGGATLDLSPTLRSPGRLEELSNSTFGSLDLSPFGTGAADDLYDLFIVLHLADGRVLHNTRALRVHATTVELPAHTRHPSEPNPGGPIELVDAAGAASGLMVSKATFHPGQVEIDASARAQALVEIVAPGNVTERVPMSGPSTTHVFFERLAGAAVDDDGDGLDEVEAEIASLDLAGSADDGLLIVRLSTAARADGVMEEVVDLSPGVLDVPPFAPSGAVDSFFDVFFDVDLPDGTTLHTQDPKQLGALLSHEPPGPGTHYDDLFQTPLYDALGVPSGYAIGSIQMTPHPAPDFVETDQFTDSTLILKMASGTPIAPPQTLVLRGPSESKVYYEGPGAGTATDDDGDLLDDVQTELTVLDLSDGFDTLRLAPNDRSPGLVEEQVDTATGTLDLQPFGAGRADSLFDLLFEVDLPGGITLHNPRALRLLADTDREPSLAPFFHVLPPTGPVELEDTQGSPAGAFVIDAILHRGHVEVDQLNTIGSAIHLTRPGGVEEPIITTGTAALYTYFEVAEGVANDGNGNGRDEVESELGELDLRGTGSEGSIQFRLRPATHSLGVLEEQTNTTPGLLDIPPFAATGAADATYGVYFEVELPTGAKLHTAAPSLLTCTLTSKPPGPNDVFTSAGQLELLDESGLPSGYFIGPIRLVPEPAVVWLLGAGLAGLAAMEGLRRKGRRSGKR